MLLFGIVFGFLAKASISRAHNADNFYEIAGENKLKITVDIEGLHRSIEDITYP
jgi:hypothetical protein